MNFPLVPDTIFAEDFRVVRPLGQGGMGSVYVVEQLSTGRQRALKTMSPALITDDKSRDRFLQEARIGARIESDHVVEVIAAGIDEGSGTPWLAMELLEGETLAEYVGQRGPLPPAEVLEVMRQLCHGIGAAHDAGLVHRDIKPENIFLAKSRRQGATFTLKVLDFGVAKMLREVSTTGNTTQGVGSPLFMAPEQTDAGHVSPATDVWALGLVAFILCTGQPYWRNANQERGTLNGLLVEIVVDQLDAASTRAALFGRSVPDGFDAFFERCVTRDPATRFADAHEALAALEPILSGAQPNHSDTDPFAATAFGGDSGPISSPPRPDDRDAKPPLAEGSNVTGPATNVAVDLRAAHEITTPDADAGADLSPSVDTTPTRDESRGLRPGSRLAWASAVLIVGLAIAAAGLLVVARDRMAAREALDDAPPVEMIGSIETASETPGGEPTPTSTVEPSAATEAPPTDDSPTDESATLAADETVPDGEDATEGTARDAASARESTRSESTTSAPRPRSEDAEEDPTSGSDANAARAQALREEARAALSRGDTGAALRLARQSLRAQRSVEAHAIIGEAYCQRRDLGMANAAAAQLPAGARRRLIRYCAQQGLRLNP